MNRKNRTIVAGAGFFIVFTAIIGVSSVIFGNSSHWEIKNSMLAAANDGDSQKLSAMENPQIVVRKKARKLELFDGEKLIKTYKIALGFAPIGDKEREGDGKTPEGEFYIYTKNAKSRFYLSLGVSYPNAEDAERGLKKQLISKAEHDRIIEANAAKKMPPQKTKLGGEIYIHGKGVSSDWTWGCVALADADMKEIFDAIPVGAKVRILP